jgi:ribosome recycling factor
VRVLAVDKTVDSDAGAEIEEQAMEKMDKSFEAVKRSFSTVRTGRANPGMLDRIEVDYYGAISPLRTIAGISAPDAQSLVVQPYDISAMPNIEKAILKSDLGITPSNDGKIIRINIPPLTAERRKEMAKTVSKLSEDGKVAIRNVRRDSMKQIGKLKKDGDMSEDGAANLETTIQELTDDYVKQVETLAKEKSEELTNI